MASPNSSPQIVALADKISTAVAELQGLLSAQGVPSPSWAENNPECLPANVASLQDTVLDATAELHELLLEPFSLVFKFAAVSLAWGSAGSLLELINDPRFLTWLAWTRSVDSTLPI